MRALIVVLWRAGLRISEALALAESDLDARRGAILVRLGKGGKRREVGDEHEHGGRGARPTRGVGRSSIPSVRRLPAPDRPGSRYRTGGGVGSRSPSPWRRDDSSWRW